jgi:hypothetical protein
MSRVDELRAAVAELEARVEAGEQAVADLRADAAAASPQDRPRIVAALRRAQQRLSRDRQALADARAELDALLADPLRQLPADFPIVLLPVRIETRFAMDAAGQALLVRVYPDEIAVDDHRDALTEAEVAAAARFWERVWRAGRSDPAAERSAFVDLAAEVGLTRALFAMHATAPDDQGRPSDPVPPPAPLASPPVLADLPRAGEEQLEPAVSRVLPDRWTVLGFRGGALVAQAEGLPILDPLPLGPSAATAALPNGDGAGPPLEDAIRWLADFEAALAVGMAVRVPLSDTAGFDRLIVLGVRPTDPETGARAVEQLLDAQRYADGLGFLAAGAPTNNTDADRSAWTRFPDAAAAFDADRERTIGPSANAATVAAALGVEPAALAGTAHAAGEDTLDARAMQVALWPATAAYFLETLMHPVADDATVAAVRELFVEAVRGLGPLPALRIGRQPYGLLPAIALRRWRPAAADAPQHRKLVDLIGRLAPEWLAATARAAPRAVPRVGRPGADPDQELLAILGRDAQSGSYRLRPARGDLSARATAPLVGTLDGGGALADAAHRLVGGGNVRPRLAGFQWDTRTARIRRAPVIEGALSETDPLPPDPASGRNYLEFLAQRRKEAFGGPGVRSLLFQLAQYACRLADADVAVQLRRPPSVATAKAVLEPDLVDVDSPAGATETLPRLLARPARDVVGGQIPPNQTVEEFVATATPADIERLGLGDLRPVFGRAAAVRAALGRLARRPTAALDRLVRATLDVCSHRLDAWMTAYAIRRLADVRALHPRGVVIGAYAWVEDLRPKPASQPVATPPAEETGPLVTDPTGAGYVVAPSPTQAATAALLLSGHLSHRGASGPAAGAFAVDLSSDRVRLAKWLLAGIRHGQPLGALLGYRFERGLHDRSGAGVELDRFIRPVRALAPLVAGRTEDVAATVEAVEAVAASNVVDGLTLLARFQADASFVDPALASATPAERRAVLEELAALADAADALADLLSAETVYQLASGNVARAAATLDALGSGLAPPPEPEVVRTPRPAHAYLHRLLALAPTAPTPAPGWESARDRPRRIAEPRLDAWAARLFGPADRIRAVVRLVGADGAVALRELTLADVGACALDLVYDAAADVELMATSALAGVPAGVRAEIVRDDDPDWPGATWPAGTLSLDDALARGRWIADALGTARAMTAVELAPAGATTGAAVVEGELADRLSEVGLRYGAAVDELRAALAEPDSAEAHARVREAVVTLADFGVAGARQAAQAGVGQPEPALRANAESILAATEAVVRVLEQPAVDVEGRTAAFEAIFGPDFVVLPLVVNPHGDWSSALAAGAAPGFLDGDPAAPLAWLQRAARVRAPVDRYLLATAGSGGFVVAQLPPAARWVGLELEGERPASATSIVVHAGPVDGDATELAGLVIDEWYDLVPAERTTAAVAFQFDEPGARAPQAVLLAVPPELGAGWSRDVVVDTISEAADLARIRMAGPEEVPWLGRYLPALYVADNAAGDALTIGVHDLVASDVNL